MSHSEQLYATFWERTEAQRVKPDLKATFLSKVTIFPKQLQRSAEAEQSSTHTDGGSHVGSRVPQERMHPDEHPRLPTCTSQASTWRNSELKVNWK